MIKRPKPRSPTKPKVTVETGVGVGESVGVKENCQEGVSKPDWDWERKKKRRLRPKINIKNKKIIKCFFSFISNLGNRV